MENKNLWLGFMSQARRTRHFARETIEWKRRNKAPVTSPLFWLFHPPSRTNIDWRWWCQKDQSKHDPLLENFHFSGHRIHWQRHKLQVITTRGKNKICSESKLVYVQTQRRERIEGKQGHVSHYHELRSCVWPCQSKNIFPLKQWV